MKTNNTIAPHEVLELHELVTFKNLCATKSATMASLVKDEELKSIMQQDLIASQSHIKELQDLLVGASTTFNSSSKSTIV